MNEHEGIVGDTLPKFLAEEVIVSTVRLYCSSMLYSGTILHHLL